MQVVPAAVEGGGLLNTTLETYSAMRVIEETFGPEQLREYLQFMRLEYLPPRTRAASPLLRASDSFAYSRRGPFALYAIREYIGKSRIDDALRRLFEKHRSGTPPLPTSMDLLSCDRHRRGFARGGVSNASGEVEKRAELPAHDRLLHGDIAGELVLVEHSPNRCDESRQLARERGVVSGGARKHPQFLGNEIVERVLHPEASLDRPRSAALLDPDLLEAHDGSNIPA
jgi:hypothetical protein